MIFALREADHDVLAIAEVAKGAVDERVMERALSERRVLITEDRDFGELVYRRGGVLPNRLRGWGAFCATTRACEHPGTD